MTSSHFRNPVPVVHSHEGPPGCPWSLRVEAASGELTWHALELDAYDVGREVERGVLLDSRDVSRLHARLERDDGGHWWIVPKADRADTLVNGKPARHRRRLSPWDDVQLGGFHLRLVSRDGLSHTPERLLELLTPFLDDVDSNGRAPPARVRIYEGPLGGHDVRLDKGIVVFGSGRDASVLLEGRRNDGVCVEFRAIRDGFEAVDRSERPSMTINGRVLQRFLLTSDELVGIGDVERQRKDARDALGVRFLPNERRPGQDTTPAPRDTVRMQNVPGVAPTLPAPDATDRTLGSSEATASDTDPGTGSPGTGTAPTITSDTAVDFAAPYGPPAEGESPISSLPTWPEGGAPGADEPPTSQSLHNATAVSTPQPADSAPSTWPPPSSSAPSTWPAPPPSSRPPSSRSPSSGRSREAITEPAPPPPQPTVPPPSASSADAQRLGRMDADADADAGGSAVRRRAGVALASLVAVVLFWFWWKPSPIPGATEPTPRPTASDVATNVPGPVSASSPAVRPLLSAPEPPPVPPPRRAPAPSADAPTPTRPPMVRQAPPSTSPKGPRPPAGDDAPNALQKQECLRQGGGDCTTTGTSP